MLFWKDLSGYLIQQGFELNPYDNCIANKQINGSQCTILWHVDNLKIFHMSNVVLDEVIADLNDRYRKLAPLTVTCSTVHKYPGMTLNYSIPGKVIIQLDG